MSLEFPFNSFQGENPRYTTFGYWLGVIHDAKALHDYVDLFDAHHMADYLKYQFDVEGQASSAKDVGSDDSWIPSIFEPVAPVTLTNAWSPFDLAMSLMGPPKRLSVSGVTGRSVLMHWDEFGLLGNYSPQTSDESHFLKLLKATWERGTNAIGITLVGCAGWDFARECERKIPNVVKNAWREFGFVELSRVPVEGEPLAALERSQIDEVPTSNDQTETFEQLRSRLRRLRNWVGDGDQYDAMGIVALLKALVQNLDSENAKSSAIDELLKQYGKLPRRPTAFSKSEQDLIKRIAKTF